MSFWTTSGASRLRRKRKLQQGEASRYGRKGSGGFEREAQAKASLLQLPLHQIEQSQEFSTADIDCKQRTRDGYKRQLEQPPPHQQPRRRSRGTSFTSSRVIRVQPRIQSFQQNHCHTSDCQRSLQFENANGMAMAECRGQANHDEPLLPPFSQHPCGTNFDHYDEFNDMSHPSIIREKGVLFTDTMQQPNGQAERSFPPWSSGISAHIPPPIRQPASLQMFQQVNEDQDLSAFFGINSGREGNFESQFHESHSNISRGLHHQIQYPTTAGANDDHEELLDEDFLLFKVAGNAKHNQNGHFPMQPMPNGSVPPWESRHTCLNPSRSGLNYSSMSRPIVFDRGGIEEIELSRHQRGQIVRFFDNGVEVNPGRIPSLPSTSTSDSRLRTAMSNKHNPELFHQGMGSRKVMHGKTNEPLADVTNSANTTPSLPFNRFQNRKKVSLKASPLLYIPDNSHIVCFKGSKTAGSTATEVVPRRDETWNLFG
jgi:hypothetical protein